MREKVFVDTSAFYSAKDSRDKNNKKALHFLSKVLRTDRYHLITTNFILYETLTLLRRKLGHKIAVEFREELKKSYYCSVYRITEDIEEIAWNIFKRYKDKDFSFVDCTSFAFMKANRIKKAFAFDEHFTQFGFEKVI